MDLKGITWVGHVYQKFEAVCLEVEEIMYQDTVNYVENQMQTVQKLYLDVIEDFLPPSSMDLVKGKVASNLPAEQNTDIGICKKPKVGIKEEAMKVDTDSEQLSEDSLATADLDKGAGHGQSYHGFHFEDTSFQASSGDTIKGACSDVYSEECDVRSGHDQSSLCMQKISKEENLLPSETSVEIPHVERDLSRGWSSCELVDKNQAADDQVGANPTSVTAQVASCKHIEEVNYELENGSKGAAGFLTSSPSSKNCDGFENASARSSCSSLSAELNGHSDYLDMDWIESSNDVEQGFETIQQVDNMQVEETCVLVNGDELCFVPRKEGKHSHRPYRKKIQDAISSRMRSARKHEYKQLAVWYDKDEKSKQENAEKGSPSHGYSELEWELL